MFLSTVWRIGFASASLLLVHCVARAKEPLTALDYQRDVQPLLEKYCFDCHGGGVSEGDLELDQFADLASAIEQPQLWWNVLKNVRSSVMPPASEARPTADELATISNWIKFGVFQIDPKNPDPGRLSTRRLNRNEYSNTINDLMGTRFNAALLFPPDDAGHGFDNVGDALGFSPLLMEKYLQAARTVVEEAVPTVTKVVPRQVLEGRVFRGENADVTGRSLDGKQAARVRHSVTVDRAGIHSVQVNVKLHGSFDFDPARYTVTLSIDDHVQSEDEYGWDENRLLSTVYELDWQAGDHEFVFDLQPIVPTDEEALEKYSSNNTNVRFEVQSVRVEGPLATTDLVHPPNYARFFTRDEPPQDPEQRRLYAEEVLRRFATRAFRGSVDAVTLQRLVQIAESIYSQPEQSFEAGVSRAMVSVLASPRFLFRLESTPKDLQQGDYGPVDELTLAARLSYFLWSSMPDDELFALAESEQLRAALPQQVQRMMQDDRGQRFVSDFVGQWLRTRDITQTTIDPIIALGHQAEYERLSSQFRGRFGRGGGRFGGPPAGDPEDRARFQELRELAGRFNGDLKQAIQRETEMFVQHIIQEDRSLLELLDSDYTFLNEPLAKHYGIDGVRGNEMRRVDLPEGSPRGGVLTQASMLLVTSNPTRTSPVKRGLFVLDNILGTPAPPAPPDVPELEESTSRFGDREPTLRELLAAHRESALCASCHARMDPLGLALENFNALGMWRQTEQGLPIDPSGELITGEAFEDIRELKQILRGRYASNFYRCVTEKLMTYALGRGLEYTDEHTIDQIVEKLERSGGKFSVLLQGVIDSAPFQKQRFAQY